jgi:hypothetical protein
MVNDLKESLVFSERREANLEKRLDAIREALGDPVGGPSLEDVARRMRENATAFGLLSEVLDQTVSTIVAANRLAREVMSYRQAIGGKEPHE